MPRLFVAIRPPQPVRAYLISIMGAISGARWQSDDQIHLTLRFIGEVDARQAEDIHTALDAVRQTAFDIAVQGLGTFDRRGEPTALWAGVSPQAPLADLHKKVDQACQRAGLTPERRAYHPHITLARLNRATGPLAAFFDHTGAVATPPFRVDSFLLYESHLGAAGANYTPVARYGFA